MRINLSGILKDLGKEQLIEYETSFNSVEWEGEYLRFKEPVKVKAIFTNTKEDIIVSSEVSTVLNVKCHRCLTEFPYEMNIQFKEEIKKHTSSVNFDKDVFYLDEDNTIDFDEIVKMHILLNLPMRFICNVGCKGLCSKCGQNLNIKSCNCKEDIIDERLLVLRDFYRDNKEV